MKKQLHIMLLGPAHPFRGGLAAIIQTMARFWQREGKQVEIKTFTVQYPEFLFPGKSQYTSEAAPEDLSIECCVHTANPFNWLRIGFRLKRQRPDVVILKYWTPFMGPCFGTIARLARSNGHTKFICQIDNVEPHESHFFDRWLNRWFLRAIDGFVYMSEQVHRELRAYTSAPALFSPHPMFENYGEPIERQAACRALQLDPQKRYVLFFGLIREYKGLDWLLDAWLALKRAGKLSEEMQLLVAGEFYTDKAPYLKRLEIPELRQSVVLHDRFIPDSEVKHYFSAADFLVLPYKSATQSGVTQIAYKFRLPVIVTDVGGLKEIVPHDRVGWVAEPSVEGVARAIEALLPPETLDRYRKGMAEEAKRFSWEEMCKNLLKVYAMCRGNEK